MKRAEDQCPNCVCHYSNWEEEVSETMEHQAPGEECSLGQYTFIPESCPYYQPKEREA